VANEKTDATALRLGIKPKSITQGSRSSNPGLEGATALRFTSERKTRLKLNSSASSLDLQGIYFSSANATSGSFMTTSPLALMIFRWSGLMCSPSIVTSSPVGIATGK